MGRLSSGAAGVHRRFDWMFKVSRSSSNRRFKGFKWMRRVLKFGKIPNFLSRNCSNLSRFPVYFWQIHENLSPGNFSYSLLSAKKFTIFFPIEGVIWRSFSIKNNWSALIYLELRITAGYGLCRWIYYNFNIVLSIFFIALLITD